MKSKKEEWSSEEESDDNITGIKYEVTQLVDQLKEHVGTE